MLVKGSKDWLRRNGITPLNPDALDTDFVSKAYVKFNLEPTVSLGLSYKTDIASEDQDRVKAGRELLFKALDKTIDVGSSNLCGVIHSALQKNDAPKTDVGYANSFISNQRSC